MECRKCKGSKLWKNGKSKGQQKYKCKECGHQFIPSTQKGYSKEVKRTACLLYMSGLSLRTIGKLLGVSATSVLYWVRDFAKEQYEKPEPIGDAVYVELDEMWHFIGSKKTSYGFGKHIVVTQNNLSTGNVAVVMAIPLESSLIDFPSGQ